MQLLPLLSLSSEWFFPCFALTPDSCSHAGCSVSAAAAASVASTAAAASVAPAPAPAPAPCVPQLLLRSLPAPPVTTTPAARQLDSDAAAGKRCSRACIHRTTLLSPASVRHLQPQTATTDQLRSATPTPLERSGFPMQASLLARLVVHREKHRSRLTGTGRGKSRCGSTRAILMVAGWRLEA